MVSLKSKDVISRCVYVLITKEKIKKKEHLKIFSNIFNILNIQIYDIKHVCFLYYEVILYCEKYFPSRMLLLREYLYCTHRTAM